MCTRFEQAVFVVDLGKLVRRARAKSFALRPRHIRVADLAFEPGTRRKRGALLALEPRHGRSGLAPDAVRAHHLDEHAFAQAAVGSPQTLARKRAADGVEGDRAGEHEAGASDTGA